MEDVMNHRHVIALAACPSLLMLVACDKSKMASEKAEGEAVQQNAAAPAHPSDPIESAMAAAPAAIAKDAKIISMKPDGTMSVLREGANGWTCMPDNPQTPGPDPMCMDANAMKWVEAWLGHKTPPGNNVGLMYMLSGGTDFSNTDPYAKQPGNEGWVKTGPHLMVVGAPSLTAQYSGGASPDTSVPYIMWEGTPYAHVMVPIE